MSKKTKKNEYKEKNKNKNKINSKKKEIIRGINLTWSV